MEIGEVTPLFPEREDPTSEAGTAPSVNQADGAIDRPLPPPMLQAILLPRDHRPLPETPLPEAREITVIHDVWVAVLHTATPLGQSRGGAVGRGAVRAVVAAATGEAATRDADLDAVLGLHSIIYLFPMETRPRYRQPAVSYVSYLIVPVVMVALEGMEATHRGIGA